MIKKALLITAALLAALAARADEGMWLPALISQRTADMQSKGCRLSAEDIYSVNQASLKDAVVLFGRGCTGEMISPDGLLLTNHHCGFPQIQKHSSIDHDYLRDGFWAMSRSEELPNEGLSVSFLVRMEDVTSVILKDCTPEMTESERSATVKANSKALIKEVTAGGKGLRATVEALYYGNQYFLFLYREYSDVRLVGAPPSSIGKFGGDTDNWMWPRHTGDFSIFRVYADKDNNPAPYSADNVPYHPAKYLKISTGGVKEGDFTFIYGFPGRTQEYIHSEGVRYVSDISDPAKIALRTARLGIQKKYMEADRKVRIQYASKNASVANSWKKWQGESRGLRKMQTVKAKQEYEAEFSKWAEGSQYEGLTEKIAGLYAELEPLAFAADYYSETARAVELTQFAGRIASALRSEDSSRDGMIASQAASFYKDWYLPIDKEIFISMMESFDKTLSDEYKPLWLKNKLQEYGNISNWAEHIFSESVFTDSTRVASLTPADTSLVDGDPAVEFAVEFGKWYASEILPGLGRINSSLQPAYRDYMRGQMEYSADPSTPSRQFYPDANLTLRVAYGNVKGYSPSDGIVYRPYSTLKGIIEKDNPEIYDYNIPQRLRDIYASRDFGKWTTPEGEVPVCFLATNHTSGGNSGSPVLNADGDLIGINFDRVWEGTMSDIAFDPDFCRNIALDIRYVLFTIEKIGNASWLFNELSVIE
ncbi:MAG: S46 family peptidase [Candidatus Cryptobacteroides sp.]